jgi:hypothetical protein
MKSNLTIEITTTAPVTEIEGSPSWLIESEAVKRYLALGASGKVLHSGNRYPQRDGKIELHCANGLSLTIEDSGMRFAWKNATSKRVVTYTDTLTGIQYRVSAKAWEINGGARIQTALSINDVFKGSNSYMKHRSDNAVHNMVASSEKAVLYSLNHAESLVIKMASRDRVTFKQEYAEWSENLAAV